MTYKKFELVSTKAFSREEIDQLLTAINGDGFEHYFHEQINYYLNDQLPFSIKLSVINL